MMDLNILYIKNLAAPSGLLASDTQLHPASQAVALSPEAVSGWISPLAVGWSKLVLAESVVCAGAGGLCQFDRQASEGIN